MTTFEIMEKPWEMDEAPALVVSDYVAARKAVVERGGKFAMREKLTALRQRAFFAEVYAFHFNTHGGWANFTLCEDTGELNIQSDWGDWQYAWPQPGRGKGTLKDFIMRTGTCYLADKLTRGEDKKFDADKTIAGIKADKDVAAVLKETPFLEDELDELAEFGNCESFMTMLYMKDELEPIREALGSDMHENVPVSTDKGSYLFLRDSLLVFFKRFLREGLVGATK